jgi:hypothetical protein
MANAVVAGRMMKLGGVIGPPAIATRMRTSICEDVAKSRRGRGWGAA